jgi:hypothetical protein
LFIHIYCLDKAVQFKVSFPVAVFPERRKRPLLDKAAERIIEVGAFRSFSSRSHVIPFPKRKSRLSLESGRDLLRRPSFSKMFFHKAVEVSVHRHFVALPLLSVLPKEARIFAFSAEYFSLPPFSFTSSLTVDNPRPRVRAISPKLLPAWSIFSMQNLSCEERCFFLFAIHLYHTDPSYLKVGGSP